MQVERRAQRLERSCLSLPPQPQPCGTGTGRHTVICRLAVLGARHTLLRGSGQVASWSSILAFMFW